MKGLWTMTDSFTKAVKKAITIAGSKAYGWVQWGKSADMNWEAEALAAIQAAALELVGEDESIWSQTALPGAPGGVVDETKRGRNALRKELRAKIRGEG